MKYLLPLIFLFALACRQEQVCTFKTDGVCFNIDSQFIDAVDPNKVSEMLQFTTNEFNKHYGPVDFVALAKETDYYAMTRTKYTVEQECGIDTFGCYITEADEVYISGEYSKKPAVNCVWYYRVLAHETLHFLSEHTFGGPGKDHMKPWLFLDWTIRTNKYYTECVEGQAVKFSYSLCGDSSDN
jgi:hypothetical protein